MLRRAAIIAAAAAIALPASLLNATQAQAHDNCTWPWVCLWDVRTDPDRKFQFQDVGRQSLPVANAVDHIRNTRRDDVVWLWDVRTSPDSKICVAPETHLDLGAIGWHNRVDAIEIRTESKC